MSILTDIQAELKAPKSQYNSFGKYHYRSLSDIDEAVKPLLVKHKAELFLDDEVVVIGDRYYVKATATFKSEEGTVVSKAYAREDETKKGMDGSQITGTASSYARKYALNGLFLIDDTKDADTEEYQNQTNQAAKKQADSKPKSQTNKISKVKADSYKNAIDVIIRKTGKADGSIMQWFCERLGVIRIDDITEEQISIADGLIAKMQSKRTEGA